MTRIRPVALLALFFSAAVNPPRCLAEPDPLDAPSIHQIADRIRSNIELFKSFHVKYMVTSTTSADIELKAAERFGLFAEREEYARNSDRLFRARKFWERSKGSDGPDRWWQNYYAFDGSVHRILESKCEPPDQPQIISAVMEPIRSDAYYYNGNIYHESIGSPFYDGRSLDVWRRHPDREPDRPFSIAAALDKGGYRIRPEMESVGGAECWVVDAPGQDVLWLDPTKGYALMRREWYWGFHDNNAKMFVFENSRFKEIDDGVWLPMRVRREVMANPHMSGGDAADKAIVVNECNVITLAISGLDDGIFTIDFPPGTDIVDSSRTPYEISEDGMLVTSHYVYTVGPDPETTRMNLEKVIAIERGLAGRSMRWKTAILILTSLALPAGFFLLMAWRRCARALGWPRYHNQSGN